MTAGSASPRRPARAIISAACLLAAATAGFARASDGIPVTIVAKPSRPVDACIEGIRESGSGIGADRVEIDVVTDAAAVRAGRTVAINLLSTEGNDPMEMTGWPDAASLVRRPFAFKDAGHFRRFQMSPLATGGDGVAVAYGGAHHLFSFRLPMTEPAHFAGRSVLGDGFSSIYRTFGATSTSWVDRDWTHDARLLIFGETRTRQIESDGIAERIAAIRADRDGVAGFESPLFAASDLGIDRVAKFLNLSFSSVDPILIDATALVAHVPAAQSSAAEAWVKAIGLACSAGVFQAEEKLIAGMKARGVKVAPMNRAAFAPAVWMADLGYAYDDFRISQFDKLVALGWQAGKLPSQMMSALPDDRRNRLIERDKAGAAAAAAALKEHESSAAARREEARAKAIVDDVAAAYAQALRAMPPMKPSGGLAALFKLPVAQPIIAKPPASSIADDLAAVLAQVETCPRAAAPCVDQIGGWLDIARVRAATRSRWALWARADDAVDRAIALARSATDGTFPGNIAAAEQLRTIAEVQGEIGDPALRKTVDAAAAALDVPWPFHPSDDEEKNAEDLITRRLSIETWLVMTLGAVGDDAGAKARLKKAQDFVLRTRAVVDDQSWPDTSDDFWRMNLAVGDEAQAWSHHIDWLEHYKYSSARFTCWYGPAACAGRRDVRRASVLTLKTLALALKDAGVTAAGTLDRWQSLLGEAFLGSGSADLAREHGDIVRIVQALSVSAPDPEDRAWATALLKYEALPADAKAKVICAQRKCVNGDPAAESDRRTALARVAETPRPLDEGHPFEVALQAKRWTTVFADLDRMARHGPDYGDEEKTYAATFPGAPGEARSTGDLALRAAEAAALADDLPTVRRAVGYDGDTREGTFAGSRPRTLDHLLKVLVSSAAVD